MQRRTYLNMQAYIWPKRTSDSDIPDNISRRLSDPRNSRRDGSLTTCSICTTNPQQIRKKSSKWSFGFSAATLWQIKNQMNGFEIVQLVISWL